LVGCGGSRRVFIASLHTAGFNQDTRKEVMIERHLKQEKEKKRKKKKKSPE